MPMPVGSYFQALYCLNVTDAYKLTSSVAGSNILSNQVFQENEVQVGINGQKIVHREGIIREAW